MTILYHYTCDHGAKGLGLQDHLLPNMHPLLGMPLVWLTDLDAPFIEPLGLTSHMLSCDRTEYRYRVTDARTCIPWVRYEHRDRSIEIDGTMPMHWWVSEQPVPVIYDPTPTRAAAPSQAGSRVAPPAGHTPGVLGKSGPSTEERPPVRSGAAPGPSP